MRERLAAATPAARGTLSEIGRIDEYPLLGLEFGPSDAPALLIDAGIHGEEPASVLGFVEWLERDGARWADRLSVTAFPCLNPYGFERGSRHGRDGLDLNRTFDDPHAPLPLALAGAIGPRRFELAMDLHEDCDFSSFYLYELRFAPPFLAPRLLRAAERLAPLSDGDEVGPARTQRGLVPRIADRNRLLERKGWPVAFHHATRCTDHVITVETPGRLALDTRIALHRACLNEACEELDGRRRGTGPAPASSR